MGEGVAWLEPYRLAVGRRGLLPQPLPLQGEPELEMGLDGARGQIERRAQSGRGLAPAALLEEEGAQIQMGSRRARPRPHHFLEFREGFLGAMLAAKGGAEQRAKLHIARSAREGTTAYDLGFGRASVGEGGLGPPERSGGLRGGWPQRRRSSTRRTGSSAFTFTSLVTVSQSRPSPSRDSRSFMPRGLRAQRAIGSSTKTV